MSDTTRPDDGTIDHIVEFSAHDDPIQDTIYILSKRDMDAIVAHIVELRTERARADRLADTIRAAYGLFRYIQGNGVRGADIEKMVAHLGKALDGE